MNQTGVAGVAITVSDLAYEVENSLESADAIPVRGMSIASRSAKSADSRTSTLKYDQEPFDQYQHRVEKLCHLLWPSASQNKTQRDVRSGGGAKSRIFNAVKAKPWGRLTFAPPDRIFTIERLSGGTYNRIIGMKISDLSNKKLEDLILRIPRANMAEFSYIEREVAILRYIRQKTTLPVADIISFDSTHNNPLDSGYVIQSRLAGNSLHRIWDTMTHEQRCDMATQLGKAILSLQEVKHPVPGLVEGFVKGNGEPGLGVRPFDIVSPHDVDWKQKITKFAFDDSTGTTTEDALQWFGTQFGRWLANELLADPSAILYWDYQIRFVEVAKQMHALGFLGDDQNCLCHFDLAAQNILVQISPDGSAVLSGIVDWDSAAFAPIFVSCAPPSWLWTDPGSYDVEEGEANITPCTAEQEEIKEIFEDVVGFDWTWFAYQPGYRLARELFHFARHGVPDGIASKKADAFFKEWAELYEMLMNPKDESENGEFTIDGDMDHKDNPAAGLVSDEDVKM